MTGYLFQARFALLRGLEEGRRHPGHALSIERFDDVAFEDAGGPFELIQTKHQAKGGNLSDVSADLWRTLNIWIKLIIEDPTTSANTRFVFLTTNAALAGSALSMLSPVQDKRDESWVLALFTVGDVYASLCKRSAYAPFTAQRRSRALFWL